MKHHSGKAIRTEASNELVVIGWKSTMAEAFNLMTKTPSRHLPVVDDNGSLVGLISDRDIKKAMTIDQADYLSAKTPQPEFDPNARVRDFMSTPVETIPETATMRTAAAAMLKKEISSLVVMRGETAVGILTTTDLLRGIADDTEDSAFNPLDSVAVAIYRSPLNALAQTLANAGI